MKIENMLKRFSCISFLLNLFALMKKTVLKNKSFFKYSQRDLNIVIFCVVLDKWLYQVLATAIFGRNQVI